MQPLEDTSQKKDISTTKQPYLSQAGLFLLLQLKKLRYEKTFLNNKNNTINRASSANAGQ